MARYYSRLRSVEERKRTRNAELKLFLAGVLIVVFVIAGIKYLSKFFLFISSLNLNNQPAVKEDYIPPSPPKIFLPFDATNSATITISGSTEPGATVYLTLNKDTVGNTIAGDDGSFVITNVKFVDGQNQLSAVAVDNSGNKSQSAETATIYYLNKPPKLDIKIPADGQNISGGNGFTEVKGMTDPNTRITVNDRVVIVSGDGSFTYRLGLNQGENQVIVRAMDNAGNLQEKTLTVNYSP